MPHKFQKSLFLFRRDLRLSDNTALAAACGQSRQVTAAFMLDPRQVEGHPYRSIPALRFMFDSLAELDTALQAAGSALNLFEGRAEQILDQLLDEGAYECVFLNRDYTPFSLKRDDAIRRVCLRRSIHVQFFDDALLHAPSEVRKADGSAYSVFTPFFRRASGLEVTAPQRGRIKNFGTHNGGIRLEQAAARLLRTVPGGTPHGGRKAALKLLGALGSLKKYSSTRDFPALDSTSHLSPHLKFGTCSIREAYQAAASSLGPGHALIRQFYWRDFFTHIAFNFPQVFKGPFRPEFAYLDWSTDPGAFNAWSAGDTGFPIVDAGMRQLNLSATMHNRVRMITASFLVKDLLMDWREGEKYFARHLVDYDPALNNGNWQWAASTGCDAQPWFRIFNPWTQQRKFDPDCAYIKRWVPELRGLAPRAIHNLWRMDPPKGYPRPIVDHELQRRRVLRLYSDRRADA